MPLRIIKKRTRYFLAVEGESERSFVRWLQQLSEGRVSVHLDTYPLCGGGYKSMLDDAVHLHGRQSKSKGVYQQRLLIVDGDRADQGDWPVAQLREEAAKHGLNLYIQRPKLEGILYRMMPGKERDIPTAATVDAKLRALWPTYQKPVNAQMLAAKFSFDDLLRVAGVDDGLRDLLRLIGLI